MKNLLKLITEIKNCVNKQMVYPALFMSLSIPDICGKMKYVELSGNKKCKQRYIQWYEQYVDKRLHPIYESNPDLERANDFDSKACYELRCALLHAGTTDIGKEIDLDSFTIDFDPHLSGVLLRTDPSIVLNKQFEWEVRNSIYIKAILLINSILEGVEAFIKEL